MQNFKIKIYLLESKSNANKEAPIYLRIKMDGRYIQLSTGIFIKPEFWDHKKKEIRAKHSDAIRLNLRIAKAKERLIDINYDLQKSGKSSLEKIKDIWTGKTERTNTILTLIDYSNNLIKNKIGQGYATRTYKQYCSLKRTVCSFLLSAYGKIDLDLGDLNMAFITKFDHYLSSQKNNSVNTVAKQIDRLKKIINVGLENEWLKEYPFKGYKKITSPSNREFLSIEEIEKIRTLDLRGKDHLERVRDIFIFICYTGISYCDLAILNENHIVPNVDGSKFIKIARTKTLEPCNIPLLPQAEEILAKYVDHPISKNKRLLLPVISNQKMNDYLKIIGKDAKINSKVTCHIGRHTFATLSLEMGVPIETVSKVLGHRSIKTTQIYGKVTTTKISKDYVHFYKKDDKHSQAI